MISQFAGSAFRERSSPSAPLANRGPPRPRVASSLANSRGGGGAAYAGGGDGGGPGRKAGPDCWDLSRLGGGRLLGPGRLVLSSLPPRGDPANWLPPAPG